MKQQIYLSISIAIGLLTACGKSQPTATVTPTPSPVIVPSSPSPIASTTPSPPLPSPVPTAPVPVTMPTVKPTPPVRPAPVAALPKSIYPTPTPVPIPVPTEPAKTKTNSQPEPLSKLRVPTDPAQQITPVGIGVAKIGMSFKELKQQLGNGFQFPVKTGFVADFDAIAVTKGGKVQYYIPYPAGTTFTDQDRIEHLSTDNPNYRTQQGVGPGTPIERAASVYGSATLSLSKDDESREFINFTKHPNGLAFRPQPPKTRTFAGDYPESNEDYLKTQKYDPKAAIGQITVSCAEEQCDREPSENK